MTWGSVDARNAQVADGSAEPLASTAPQWKHKATSWLLSAAVLAGVTTSAVPAATSSTHYLCGTGGWRYLDTDPFDAHGIPVLAFHTPADTGDPLWQWSQRLSSLWPLSQIGPEALAAMLVAQRDTLFMGVSA